MANYSWDQFTVRIPVRGSAEELYRAWTTQKNLEYWFVRYSPITNKDGKLRERDEAVQVGDTYIWRWHGWSDEVEETGTILECNNKDFLKFSFGKAGICSISIKPEGDECIVEIIQSEIPVDPESRAQFHVGCKTGWTFYLANLKSLMEGGVDLRNKNESLKGVINA